MYVLTGVPPCPRGSTHRIRSDDRRDQGVRVVIVELDSPGFAELIDPDAELTLLGSGYEFTEGPVWNPREQCLYFSDIPGDARWRWSEQIGMELVAKPT